MRGLAAAAIAVLALIAVPAAQATQRFAAPNGGGTECTQTKPCLLNEAAAGAKPGDEVIVTAGTYPITSTVFTLAVNVQIHGDTAGPMPRIVMTSSGSAIAITETGNSLSYVEIEDNANNGEGVTCLSSKLDRVRVRVTGINALGMFAFQDCVVRNSLFYVEGQNGIALRSGPTAISKASSVVRNVTAIAVGSGSLGAESEYNEGTPGEFTLELQNSIVQGGEADLKPVMGSKGPGNILAGHSNFDKSTPVGEAKVIDGGGNQTTSPLFVNAETRDFREAAGSPTIDAGGAGELGPLDLDGNARVQGAAPDIGAFEATPPPVPAPAEGRLDSLAVQPKKFRAGNVAGAVASKKRPPLGATVSYALSAAGEVEFHVEKAGNGRKVGGKCVKQTHANSGHKKCVIYKPLKGRFSVQGAAGANSFRFSGKIGGKTLKPGPYRLVGSAGNAIRRAPFAIVK
jgi:hypothetical protein